MLEKVEKTNMIETSEDVLACKYWYLVYTKPQSEVIAYHHLLQQEYDVFLPMVTRKKRVRTVYKQIEEPLFPRYLFISLDMKFDNWSPIRSTRGVTGLVRFGMEYGRVPNDFIDVMKKKLDHGTDDSDKPIFDKGATVSVVSGPFKGWDAVFHEQKGADRAVILLDLVGRWTHLKIDINQIQ